VEAGVAIVLFCLYYIAGVVIITFNEGRGISLGNLSVATWLGAIITLVMVVGKTYQDAIHNFHDHHQRTISSNEETGGKPAPVPEQAVAKEEEEAKSKKTLNPEHRDASRRSECIRRFGCFSS
jgi:hypothetical protein